jgi:NADPH:quinone reductase-like Zn-dependent oxidoreductase
MKWRNENMKHRPCGNGKGDTPRPITDREQFDKNWDSIFKKLPKGKVDAEVDRDNPMPDRDSTNKS